MITFLADWGQMPIRLVLPPLRLRPTQACRNACSCLRRCTPSPYDSLADYDRVLCPGREARMARAKPPKITRKTPKILIRSAAIKKRVQEVARQIKIGRAHV